MATCKDIQELILTDYTDAQLEPTRMIQVQEHLKSCMSCQSFAKELKEQLQTPFVKIKHQEVPFEVWASIKQRIQDEGQIKEGLWDRFLEGFHSLTLPKLAPVLAGFALAAYISSSLIVNEQNKLANNQEDDAYVEYVLASVSFIDQDDLGTPIEQYFL